LNTSANLTKLKSSKNGSKKMFEKNSLLKITFRPYINKGLEECGEAAGI